MGTQREECSADERQRLRDDVDSSESTDVPEPVKAFSTKKLHTGGRLLAIFPGSILVFIRIVFLAVGLAIYLPLILGLTYVGCRKAALLALKSGVRTLLLCLGFWYIRTSGQRPKIPEEGCVIVANHVGAVDVLYMIYDFAPAFVAGQCVLECDIIARIARDLLDSVFVEQGAQASGHTKKIIDYFAPEQPRYRRLCIFPEGTSTNGTTLLSFKTGAFLPKVPIVPIVFHMPFCSGWQFDPHYSLKDSLPYMVGMMSGLCNQMRVEYLPMQPYEKDMPVAERAQKIRGVIADAMDVSLMDLTYKDKAALMQQMQENDEASSDSESQ